MWMISTLGAIQNELGTAAHPAPDEGLIAQIAAGDQDALASLYRQTSAAVYGFLLSIVKNTHDAEELMQDTYLRIDASAAFYRPSGKPMAWIFTIARNLALMRLRSQKREVMPEQMPEASAWDEDRLVLDALLGVLQEEERQIVMLHAMAGLKHREIASLLDLAVPTVLSKYHRALRKLQQSLSQGGTAL